MGQLKCKTGVWAKSKATGRPQVSSLPGNRPHTAQMVWCTHMGRALVHTLFSPQAKAVAFESPYLWAHTGPRMKSLCTLHDLLALGQALRGMETERACSLPPGNPKSHREDRQVPRDGHRCCVMRTITRSQGVAALACADGAGGAWGKTPLTLPQLGFPGPQDTWLAFRAEEEFQKKLRICTFFCTSLPRWIGSVSMLLAFSKDGHLKAELPRRDLAFSFWSLSSLSARPRTCRPTSTSCENPRWKELTAFYHPGFGHVPCQDKAAFL